MKSIPTPLPQAKRFAGKLAIQQRVLPAYRVPFFDTLAQQCEHGCYLYAGQARPSEMIHPAQNTETIVWHRGKNHHFFHQSRYLCWQAKSLDWLQATNPDVLITETNPRTLSTDRLIRWMHAQKRPVIGWGLGAPPPQGPLASIRRQRRAQFLQQFDALLAYSEKGAQQYAHYGIHPSRIFTVYNAVAPKPTHTPSVKPPHFAPKPILIFVGRLQARKRLDLLLKACANLPSNQQPTLWIIGDGPAKADAQALAHASYPNTHFFGALRGDALAQKLNQADLFVLPGTGGLAIQEAMAHGLPVIVAQGDGTQQDLVRPENGWLVPSDNQQALTNTLQQALTDPARLRRMGKESFRIANQEININAMADRFIDAINATQQRLRSS